MLCVFLKTMVIRKEIVEADQTQGCGDGCKCPREEESADGMGKPPSGEESRAFCEKAEKIHWLKVSTFQWCSDFKGNS